MPWVFSMYSLSFMLLLMIRAWVICLVAILDDHALELGHTRIIQTNISGPAATNRMPAGRPARSCLPVRQR